MGVRIGGGQARLGLIEHSCLLAWSSVDSRRYRFRRYQCITNVSSHLPSTNYVLSSRAIVLHIITHLKATATL